MEFYEKVSPAFPIPFQSEGVSQSDGVVAQKRYLIPPPRLCPDCRQQRRLSYHNERKLYKRKCDATGTEIVSAYAPTSKYTVYRQDFYWSDSWNPLDYGKIFDFSRSFFEQFEELALTTGKQALVVQECENSDYLNFAYKVKNCYLIFAATLDEDCYF